MVRGSCHFGCEHIVVGGAALINVLGGGQDAISSIQLLSGEAGGDLQIIDVPAGDQITPQSHLSGIIRLILVIQIQFAQAAVGVAVRDDAHHLGITGFFLGQIFYALARLNNFRNSSCRWVDTICRNFSHCSVISLVLKIGVSLFSYCTVDG